MNDNTENSILHVILKIQIIFQLAVNLMSTINIRNY